MGERVPRTGVDARLILAWATARSLARGVSLPEPDRGGFRVDTGSAEEVRRYIFPEVGEGVAQVAATEALPGVLIKLCGSVEALASVLPSGWIVEPTGFVMRRDGPMPGSRLPPPSGYTIELAADGPVRSVRLLDAAGHVAARGWAAVHDGVFIYDRIATDAAHRRRGLGRTVMLALEAAAWNRSDVQLLVATEEGRALYETLGWRVLSPYSTAQTT